MKRTALSMAAVAVVSIACMGATWVLPGKGSHRTASTLLTNLVAYWKLEDPSGSLTDSTGTYTLTETSGTIPTIAGKVGNARDFEQVDTEYFAQSDQAAFRVGDTDASWSMWINGETLTSAPVVFRKRNGSNANNSYALYYDHVAERLTFAAAIDSSTDTSVQWGSALSTSTWYFVVVWHDSVNNQIGISVNNGTPVTASHTTGIQDNAAEFQLGASDNQALYWDGVIDEFGFWSKVLSASERTELYNSGNGTTYPF